MIDIIKQHYARHENECVIYMWLNVKNQQQIKTRIICISTDEAMKMIDYKKKYELENQQWFIIPDKIKNFETTICNFLRAAFDKDLINKEKYKEFCKKRLDVYTGIFYNENRICRQFFSNYFPNKNCEGYNTYDALLKNNMDEINSKIMRYSYRIEPERVGYYTDEYDRVRPITSRVSYEYCYDKMDQLWSAFELALEGKLKEVL